MVVKFQKVELYNVFFYDGVFQNDVSEYILPLYKYKYTYVFATEDKGRPLSHNVAL